MREKTFRLLKKINNILPIDMGNAFYNINNLIKHGTIDFFNSIDIETSTTCNRRCKYCPNAVYDDHLLKNNKLMEPELFKKIIDMLAKINYNGRIGPSFYNEVLMDKRIIEFVRYAHEKLPSAKITIYTNGDYLTTDIFNKLIDAGVYEFIISQHSKKPTKNMKILMKYAKNNPERGMKLKSYFPTIKSKVLYNRGGLIGIPKRRIVKLRKCMFPSNVLVINHKGDIILCCNDYFGRIVFGNVGKKTISEIWNQPKYKKIRKNLRKGKFDLDICRKCRMLVKAS